MQSNTSAAGEYLVLARDAPGVGETLMQLSSAHWDYIDRFADQLVARGPLISDEATAHLGNVHVLRFASFDAAQRFAIEEPYYVANCFANVDIFSYRNLLGETMWDRAPTNQPSFSSYAHAFFQNAACSDDQLVRMANAAKNNPSWAFVGLLGDENGHCVGMAGAADLTRDETSAALLALAEVGGLSVEKVEINRWRRGGRSSPAK